MQVLSMNAGPAFRRMFKHRQRTVACRAEVRARWCLDFKFGRKAEGTALIQEWVRDVGQPAGSFAHNTRLSSGSIGVPESRVELEITFHSLSSWEQFLGSISSKEHKAWSQRIQSMVVDGSPAWHVYQSVPLELDEVLPQQAAVHVAPPVKLKQQQQPQQEAVQEEEQPALSPEELQFEELLQQELGNLKRQPGQQRQPTLIQQPQLTGGCAGGSLEETLKQEGLLDVPPQGGDVEVVLDWKGDPMVIKPGDRMPKWL